MLTKILLIAGLLALVACSPAVIPSSAPTPSSMPPTTTALPPTETPVPPAATPVAEYERISPTAIRIKDTVITAEAVISPVRFELTFNSSVPTASAGTVDSSVKDVTFEFPDGPVLELEPNYGGGGGGGGDPQGNQVGEAMQGYLVKGPLQSGQLIHLIAYAVLDPSTGVTEPVPFEFYLLVQ